jgi:hypothetical protein
MLTLLKGILRGTILSLRLIVAILLRKVYKDSNGLSNLIYLALALDLYKNDDSLNR